MLRPGSGTFEITGLEIHQQDNAGAVRQVPGLMISRIVKDNTLADLPASGFGPDPQGAITLRHRSKALSQLEALLEVHPRNMLYALYAKRVTSFKDQPPPPDWKGVTRLNN